MCFPGAVHAGNVGIAAKASLVDPQSLSEYTTDARGSRIPNGGRVTFSQMTKACIPTITSAQLTNMKQKGILRPRAGTAGIILG